MGFIQGDLLLEYIVINNRVFMSVMTAVSGAASLLLLLIPSKYSTTQYLGKSIESFLNPTNAVCKIKDYVEKPES